MVKGQSRGRAESPAPKAKANAKASPTLLPRGGSVVAIPTPLSQGQVKRPSPLSAANLVSVVTKRVARRLALCLPFLVVFFFWLPKAAWSRLRQALQGPSGAAVAGGLALLFALTLFLLARPEKEKKK